MLKTVALTLAGLLAFPALGEPALLMAEQAGCTWCARWDEEIAPTYPKTAEGRAAPLERFDLHGTHPDVTFATPVRFTPTFILVDDGQELGRIEGYPGEDFFWPMLASLLEQAGIAPDDAS